MAEYIEREALTKELNSKGVVHQMDNENFHYKQGYLTGLLKAVIVAKTLPTADVVEVVRCGQCKLWKINPNNLYGGQCRYSECASIDHFCSRGEKRGNNNA